MDIRQLAKGLGRLAEWGVIEAACGLSPSDAATVELARIYRLRDKPRASAHLQRYLEGIGGDLQVRTQELLSQDPGVRTIFFKSVHEALEETKSMGRDPKSASGVVPVPQSAYVDQDWRNALGSINLFWKVEKDSVKVNFVNVYRWHPEAKRISQCVHQAADRMKSSGAKEFRMVGADYLIPLTDFSDAPPSRAK